MTDDQGAPLSGAQVAIPGSTVGTQTRANGEYVLPRVPAGGQSLQGRLLGYRPEEMLGLSTRMLHSERAVAEKAAELGVANDFSEVARALIGRGPSDMGFVRKDGVELDVELVETGYRLQSKRGVVDRPAEHADLIE